MHNIHPAAWIGLIINFLCTFLFLDAFQGAPVFLAVVYGAIGLIAVGIIMLGMGKAAGGIVGAVGSVLFVPIGVICLFGCMRSRQQLLLNTKIADQQLLEQAFGKNAASNAVTDEMTGQAPVPEPHDSATTASHIAALKGQPEDASAPSPAGARFPFKDQRASAVAVLIAGGVLFWATGRVSGTGIGLLVAGIAAFCMQSRLIKIPALALHDDYLTCMPSMAIWSMEETVAYSQIQSAGLSGNRGYVTAFRPGTQNTQKLRILFNAMPGNIREEAKATFADKMHALGVPWEK